MEHEFRDIYFKYHPRLFRVAYYIIKDRESAEDICQDVFLKLWDRRSQLDDIESIEGYLIQMTRNTAINHMESNQRKQRLQMELTWGVVNLNEPGPNPEAEEVKKSLERAVSELSPQCRLVFSLSRFEGLTNEEIAVYLDISKRTVETQISLAMKRFRTDLRHLFAGVLLALAMLFTFLF